MFHACSPKVFIKKVKQAKVSDASKNPEKVADRVQNKRGEANIYQRINVGNKHQQVLNSRHDAYYDHHLSCFIFS